MKNAFAAALILLISFVVASAYAQKTPEAKVGPVSLTTHFYDAVALLYVQDGNGNMKMDCTVTAFATLSKGYRFASAAHCVDGDDDKQQKLQKFYISADSKGAKTYIPAKLIEAGDKTQGDDFSLFEVDTTEHFDVIPLGDENTLTMGDSVINIGGALGMGKQFFRGYISELHMDRPPLDAGDVLWTDLMLVQIGGGHGSSGSAIVSEDQSAIIGFLVGGEQEDIGKMCVPVSKFKTFLKAVDAGTYKKTRKSDQDASSVTAPEEP